MDDHNLNRFVEKQKYYYALAYGELYHGYKASHWMWWIFPQIDGLGFSPTAQEYAIKSLDEAKAYLSHPVLGKHLREISELLVNNPSTESTDAEEIMGYPDNLKLRSCMTLFLEAAPEETVFRQVLDRYFDGKKDPKTLEILAKNK